MYNKGIIKNKSVIRTIIYRSLITWKIAVLFELTLNNKNQMKRISLLVIMVISMTSGFTQVNLRQIASKYLKEGKLDSALAIINLCVKNPTTSKDAKTWFIRGNIYLNIATSNNIKYKTLDTDPIKQALNSYKKANEFDIGKEYTEDIYEMVNWQRNNYYNLGVDYYNKKLYKEAMLAFEDGANALASINKSDTISLFYAAACAGLANEKQKQKEYYNQLLESHAKSTDIFISLSDIYRQENDSSKALKVTRAGQKLHPNDLKLLLAETNIYLTFGNKAKALKNLTLATEKEPGNANVFFALGTIYDNLSSDISKPKNEREKYFDLAVNAYKSTIKINPVYFDPNYNLAALYVNKAAEINEKANLLPPDAEKEYKKQKAEADKYLEQAIPYLEKASEIQPSDLNTLMSLKQIYTRIGSTDKLKIVNEKIAAFHK
jgi:hypothetical protein